MIQAIRNLIKRASLSLVGKDDKEYQTSQAKYLGKANDFHVINPYGLCTNPPKGSAVLLWSVHGYEENKAGIANLDPKRFKNLKEGEVVLFNYLSGTYIYLKENGDMDVEVKKNENVNVAGNATINITGNNTETVGIDDTKTILGNKVESVTGNSTDTVTGNVIVNVTGTTTVNSTGNTSVTTPTLDVTGNVNVIGNLTVSQALTVTGTGSIEGKDFLTHVHTGSPTAPTGAQSNTGSVV